MEKNAKVKLLINSALIYALFGMTGGVFYREFTKFNDFTGTTSLAVVHTHLFTLGMIFFLIMVLFELQLKLSGHKNFMLFYILYNIGLAITTATFLWRGITQVLLLDLTKSTDSMISGVAGIGHMIMGIGIIIFFIILKSKFKKN